MNAGPALSNGRLALALFLGAETMLFTPLVGVYLVLRMSAPSWPPNEAFTRVGLWPWAAAAVLIAAALLMSRRKPASSRFEWGAFVLGCLFLALQGGLIERLYREGVTPQASPVSALFYLVWGLHALHVLAGLIILAATAWRRPTAEWKTLAAIYGYFIAGVGAVLFGIFYAF